MNTDVMMADFNSLVKKFSSRIIKASCSEDLARLEKDFRHEGRQLLAEVFGSLIGQLIEARRDQLRHCPKCHSRRRHKGLRSRNLVHSFGSARLEGVYWYCSQCGCGNNEMDQLLEESFSPAMKELLCLLGSSMSSFGSASICTDKLLGVKISDNSIRKLCIEQGKEVIDNRPSPKPSDDDPVLIGSCDGTMVNTRQDRWRELKAMRLSRGDVEYTQATLDDSCRFGHRLREAALLMGSDTAGQFFFISDAAAWIRKEVDRRLSEAVHILDIWHVREHIWAAGNDIYGEGTEKARNWSVKYSRLVLEKGGHELLFRLKKMRYRDPARRQAVEKLKGFISRHCRLMEYDRYTANGWPISSGPMESLCKRLGTRLKGPGMRWSVHNIAPMAALLNLIYSKQWDTYWKNAA